MTQDRIREIFTDGESHTDCETAIGVTVGLIDSIIYICRVIADRLCVMDLDDGIDSAVLHAISDLYANEALRFILCFATPSPFAGADNKFKELLADAVKQLANRSMELHKEINQLREEHEILCDAQNETIQQLSRALKEIERLREEGQ